MKINLHLAGESDIIQVGLGRGGFIKIVKKPKMSLKKGKNELFSKTYANLGLEHTEKTLVLEGYRRNG